MDARCHALGSSCAATGACQPAQAGAKSARFAISLVGRGIHRERTHFRTAAPPSEIGNLAYVTRIPLDTINHHQSRRDWTTFAPIHTHQKNYITMNRTALKPHFIALILFHFGGLVAHAQLVKPAEGDGKFYVSVDDSAQIFINGVPFHKSFFPCPSVPSVDFPSPFLGEPSRAPSRIVWCRISCRCGGSRGAGARGLANEGPCGVRAGGIVLGGVTRSAV